MPQVNIDHFSEKLPLRELGHSPTTRDQFGQDPACRHWPKQATRRLSRGCRACCGFQNYAVERVSPGTVGLVLRGVGLMRRRYETLADVYLPLPGFGKRRSLTNFDAHGLPFFQRERDRRLITDENHCPGCDGPKHGSPERPKLVKMDHCQIRPV